ncbi:MAG: glycosyl hydrolase 53 family protein [Paludibacteraceae bacterium]|nr:glycosyl hydrolase 53 family protein [Paludibacteraceae bacterium]
MRRFLLIFATFVACLGLHAQTTYTSIEDFESGSTNATVLWSGAAAVVTNSTGNTDMGSKVLQVTDNAGYPFVNIPVSFESGKTWTDYDGIEMSIYPKTNTVESSSAKAVGVDLSLLKAYEDAGVTYKDASGNTISDVITWLGANKGVNYVRLRLFVDPTNSYAQVLAGGSSYLNQLGGSLSTVKVLGKRVKDAGLKFLLDIQYSDGWADPGKQIMPYRWTSKCTTQAKLQDSVYQYTKDVLTALVNYGATPDMVQIGNEITYGMFFTNYDSPTSKYTNNSSNINYNNTSAGSAGIHAFVTYWSSSTYSGDTYWTNLCNLINKGSQAVREVCPNAKIMLHTERSAYTTKCTASGYTTYYMAQMFYKKMEEHSVDYDVIGLSYYAEDHGTINTMNTVLSALEGSFPTKEIMLAEYGYSNNWWRGSDYTATGIGYYRKDATSYSCPLAQRDFISALITKLNTHSKVTGMFYWFAEENENGSKGPYGSAWRNSGLWANESTNYASNITTTAYSSTAGRALPALDVLADFQTAGAVVSKSAYYANTWLKFYDADGAANWLHKKVGLNVDDEWGVDFTSNGLGTWYTVRFGFQADSIAQYISAVGSAPSSINLEFKNYTNPSETNNDFYLDNVRFYKTTTESYALDFEDGTVGSASSAVSDAWCTGSQKVANNPSKTGINTSNKVMIVTNTWVEGCDLYTWKVSLPDDLSLYDSIYFDVYPTTGTSYVTLQFDDTDWTKIYDNATMTWAANTWTRVGIALSDLSDLTATHMYFGMWESGYSIDNITFHAIETAASEYTVTWNATTNGGTCATATTTVTAGNAIGTLPTATKTGATFNGWFTAATGGTQITAATVPTGDVTYYAQFTTNTYTITYNAGANGSGTVAADIKTYGVNLTLSSNTFTRDYYTQTGWSTTDGGAKAYDLGGTYTANAAITLYPYWTRDTYTITWNATANGGTCATATTTVNGGDAIGTLPEATQEDYTFDGWFTAATGGTQITAATIPTASTTYYAQFTPTFCSTYLWFNGAADRTAAGITENTTIFSGAPTANNTSTCTGGSVTIDGTTYSVTTRAKTATLSISFTIPTGYTAIFYMVAVSNGNNSRTISYTKDGGSSVNVGTVTGSTTACSMIQAEDLTGGSYVLTASGKIGVGMLGLKICPPGYVAPTYTIT